MNERNQILKEAVQYTLDKGDFHYTEEYFEEMTLFMMGLEWEIGKTVILIPCRKYGMPQLSLRAVTKLPNALSDISYSSALLIINAINQKFPFYRTFINEENNLEIAADFMIYGDTDRIRTFTEEEINRFTGVPATIESELHSLIQKIQPVIDLVQA